MQVAPLKEKKLAHRLLYSADCRQRARCQLHGTSLIGRVKTARTSSSCQRAFVWEGENRKDLLEFYMPWALEHCLP